MPLSGTKSPEARSPGPAAEQPCSPSIPNPDLVYSMGCSDAGGPTIQHPEIVPGEEVSAVATVGPAACGERGAKASCSGGQHDPDAGGVAPSAALVVFARLPVPGRVKTRLAAGVGPQAACDFYAACAQHAFAQAARWGDEECRFRSSSCGVAGVGWRVPGVGCGVLCTTRHAFAQAAR